MFSTVQNSTKILFNPLELNPHKVQHLMTRSTSKGIITCNHVSARDSTWPALQLASFRSTAGEDLLSRSC